MQRGAWTREAEIKNSMLYQLSQPGAPGGTTSIYILISLNFGWYLYYLNVDIQ